MLLLGAACALWLAAVPAAEAAADAIKVGFVDIAKVMENAPQAEAARARLESEFAPRDQELVRSQDKLKAMEDRLARDGDIMSEEARHNLEREIIGQRREIKRSRDEFREDFNIRRNEELRKLQKRVSQAIESLARQSGYDLILSNSVLYSSHRVELTGMVLDRLRDDYRKSGASASKPK